MAAEQRLVLIAIDGSEQAEKAFDCEFDCGHFGHVLRLQVSAKN